MTGSADFLIFDFETLSNIPSEAPIISMGAIAGKWDTKYTVESLRESGFYKNIDAIDQVTNYPLIASRSTLEWWEKQGDEARKVLNANDKISLRDTITEFNTWCGKNGVTQNTIVWTRGPNFDMVIYENILNVLGMGTYRPFSHWKSRDLRTACDIIYNSTTGYPPNYRSLAKELNIIKHNAMDDCILEYFMIKEWFQSSTVE